MQASVTAMRTYVAFMLATLLVGAQPALASDDESALSVSLGYATYVVSEYRPDGLALAVEYERGFSDAFAWRIAGGGGGYYGDSGLSYSGHLVGGLTYLFDVLKYVPYAQVGLGGIVIAGGDQDVKISPLVELGAGLDILHSRTFSYGIRLAFESFLLETSFFTAGVRATWRWGFF